MEQELRDVISGTTGPKIINEEKIRGLEFQIQSQQEEIEFLRSQVKLYEENSQNIGTVQNQINAEDYSAQIQRLTSENAQLNDSIMDITSNFQTKIDSLNNENSSLKSRLSQMESELVAQSQSLESEINSLHEQIKRYEDKSLNVQDISQYVREISQLKQKNANLSSDLEKITKEQEILLSENSKLQSQLSHYRNDSGKVDELENHNSDLIAENQSLNQQILQLKKEFEGLQIEKSKESTKIIESEIIITKLRSENAELRSNLDSLNSQDARKLDEDQLAQYEQVIKENHQLNSQIQQLNLSINNYNKKIKEFEVYRDDLTKKIKELIEQNSELRISVEVKESNSRKDRNQISILNTHIESLNKGMKSAESQNQSLKQHINELQLQNENQLKEISKIKTEYDNFANSVCSLLGCHEKKEVPQKIEEILEKIVNAMKLSEQASNFQNQVEFEQSKNQTLSAKIESLKHQLEEEKEKSAKILAIQPDEVSDALKKQNQTLVSRNRTLQDEIDKLTQTVIEKDSQIERLKISTDYSSKSQIVAINKSERLSYYEFTHQKTLEFLKTLSTTMERTLSPIPDNANKIKTIDKLGEVLDDSTKSDLLGDSFLSFGQMLMSEFIKPNISDLALKLKTMSENLMQNYSSKFDEIKHSIDSQSLKIDMIFRNKKRSTPLKPPPIFRSPLGKSPRFDPQSMTPRNSPMFSKSRSPFSNSLFNEEPMSVRGPF